MSPSDLLPQWRDEVPRYVSRGVIDPRAIAALLAKKCPAARLRSLAADLFEQAVRGTIHDGRPTATAGSGRVSRWKGVDFMLVPYCVDQLGRVWKALGDMTIDDCNRVAAEYRSDAEESKSRELRFIELAKAMKSAGAEIVSALGHERVKEILG